MENKNNDYIECPSCKNQIERPRGFWSLFHFQCPRCKAWLIQGQRAPFFPKDSWTEKHPFLAILGISILSGILRVLIGNPWDFLIIGLLLLSYLLIEKKQLKAQYQK